MPKPNKSKGDDGLRPEHVEIFRINQWHKTIRTGIITAGVSFGLWVVIDAVVKIVNEPKPAWLMLILALLPAFGIAGPPTILWIRRFRIFMKRDHKRVLELEARLDPNRSTSGIHPDGTADDDKL